MRMHFTLYNYKYTGNFPTTEASQKQQVISGHLPDSTAAPTHANLHVLPSDTSAVHGVPGEGGVGVSAIPCLVFPLQAVSTEHVVSVIRQLRS